MNASWTGTHPLVALYEEVLRRHDDWKARAEAAEAENAALRAALGEATLDEALRSIGAWGEIIRQAIELGEVIPSEALTVSFRQLTPAEMAYGRRVAREFVGEDVISVPDGNGEHL